MFTIYSAKETIFQPYNIPTEDIEDCRERQFAINFVQWLTGEALSLFEKPIKLIAILCLWWPVNLYG